MDVARSTTTLFLAEIIGTVVSFLGLIYFSQELGAEVLGILFLFQALAGILTMATNLGTRGGVEKRMSEGSNPSEILSTGLLLKGILIAIVGAVIFLLAETVNQYIGIQIAGLLVIAVALKDYGTLMEFVLRGELRVSTSAVLPILNKFVWIGTGVFLVSIGYGVYGLIYGVIAGFLSKVIVGGLLISTPLGQPSVEYAHSIWSYAKYTIIPAFDEYIHNWTDILIMGVFLTSAAVGAYEVAWRILVPIFILSNAVSMAVFPQISAWDADGDQDRIERIFPKALTPSVMLIIPAFFGALLLSNEILVLLFGEDFGAATLALPILVLGLVPRAIRVITGKTLQGLDKPQFVNRASIIDMGTNVVLNVILIWYLGLVGAAIATSLSYTVGATVRWYYLENHLTLSVPYRELGWCLLSSIGMFGLITAVHHMMVIDSVLRLFSIVGLGGVAYGALLMLYSPLRETLFVYVDRVLPTTI